MTISKERLSELALEVATNSQVFTEALMGDYELGITNFAHALLKRVEQESEVAGYVDSIGRYQSTNYKRKDIVPLIALPLVEE